MARYVTLIRFTEQGAKNLSESPTRARAFREVAERSGVKVEAQYWTTGGCDGILILNAADESKALHCLADLTAQGNIRTETMRAFDAGEFSAITAR
jgi:uncharacterized protein with GYD domain